MPVEKSLEPGARRFILAILVASQPETRAWLVEPVGVWHRGEGVAPRRENKAILYLTDLTANPRLPSDRGYGHGERI